MRRIVVAVVTLLLGAVAATFFVLIATNGFDTGRADSGSAALIYLVIALLIVLLLVFASAAASRWLSKRFGWRGAIALPVVLIPALLLELVALLFVGVGIAAFSTSIS